MSEVNNEENIDKSLEVEKQDEQTKNKDSWNKTDFIILGLVFVFFIIGMIIALHMDLISMEMKDRIEESKRIKMERKAQEPEEQIDFTDYMHYMQKEIKKEWTPTKKVPEKPTVVMFGLSKKGEIIETAIIESCGDPELDEAAKNAIVKAGPFKPLPKKFKGEAVRVNFKFDFAPDYKKQ